MNEVPAVVLAIEQWQESRMQLRYAYDPPMDMAAAIRRAEREWQYAPSLISDSAARWLPDVGWVSPYAVIDVNWEAREEEDWAFALNRIRNRQNARIPCPVPRDAW